MIIVVGASALAAALPGVNPELQQPTFDSLIRLDGVLFGFTAVMLGLFFRDIVRISEKTAFRALVFIMVSFFSYIVSIIVSFTGLTQISGFPNSAFFALFLTVAGLVSSSIYIVMVLVDEYYPEEIVRKTQQKEKIQPKEKKEEPPAPSSEQQ
jgi:vacuolar-type H+-ATPase subunit I/STV1